MKKRGLLITMLSLAIVMLAGVTCFAFGNKLSANAVEDKTSTTKSVAGLLNLGDKWNINLKYTPNMMSANATSTIQQVYEYRFTNTSKNNPMIFKKSSSAVIDNMTITYAYSSTPVTNYSNLVAKTYEDTVIEAGNTSYVYMILTVTDVSQVATYIDSVKWDIGSPIEITYGSMSGLSTYMDVQTKSYAVLGMPMNEPNAPAQIEGLELEGWYTDSGYANKITFPYNFTSNQTIYPRYIPTDLDTDWFAVYENDYWINRGDDTLTGEIAIPAYYNDGTNGWRKVVRIWDKSQADGGVFKNQSGITKVNLPKTLTYIGDYAFNSCSGLTEINLEYVTRIDGAAFRDCTSLTEVYIPNTVTRLEDVVFYGCTNLKKVHLPEGLTKIGGYTFYHCDSLTEVSIPIGITSIGEYAFSGCKSLKSVDLGKCVNLTSIGKYAFNNCTELTSIGDLSKCTQLNTIDALAFFEDSKLTGSLIIPASVTKIGERVFRRVGFSSITFVDPNGWHYTSNNAYTGGDNNTFTASDLAVNSTNYLKGINGYNSYYGMYWYK